jgi:hypothetical protein
MLIKSNNVGRFIHCFKKSVAKYGVSRTAERFEMSGQNVRKLSEQLGVECRKQAYVPLRSLFSTKTDLMQFHRDLRNVPIKDLAAKHGVSVPTLYAYVKRNNLPYRQQRFSRKNLSLVG